MLAVKETGYGIPLVLVHAFPFSKKMWVPTHEVLSREVRVISMDLPGFGESPLLGQVTTMEDMARAVMQSLDKRGLEEKAFFVGISMGGYVLFQLQRLFPDRVGGLVLAATRAAPDTDEIRAVRKKNIQMIQEKGMASLAEGMVPKLFSGASLRKNAPCVHSALGWIREAPPEGVCAALRGMAKRPDSRPSLSHIRAPVLVLSGQDDLLVPPDEMRLMAGAMPLAQFESIPNAGHLINLEQPDIFHDRVLNFLKTKKRS